MSSERTDGDRADAAEAARVMATPQAAAAERRIAERRAEQDAIELAWGLLWRCRANRATHDGERIYQARQALAARLDRAGQERGLEAAGKRVPFARESRNNSRNGLSPGFKTLKDRG